MTASLDSIILHGQGSSKQARPNQVLEPIQPSTKYVLNPLSPEINQSEHNAGQSPASSTEVRASEVYVFSFVGL
jgi:hypothetical protein